MQGVIEKLKLKRKIGYGGIDGSRKRVGVVEEERRDGNWRSKMSRWLVRRRCVGGWRQLPLTTSLPLESSALRCQRPIWNGRTYTSNGTELVLRLASLYTNISQPLISPAHPSSNYPPCSVSGGKTSLTSLQALDIPPTLK